MPRIRTTGISTERLLAARQGIFDDMESLLQCPRTYMVLLASGDTPLPEPGEAVVPFVEVAWFDRGEEVQDRVAQALTERLKAVGCEAPDVVFLKLERRAYYEDGAHF